MSVTTSTTSDLPAPRRGRPQPVLSVFDAVMIITGIVVGAGIFSFPPLVASITGSVQWMFAAWLLGALLSLIGALCYAELATTFPTAGGDYHFLTRAYGKDLSFFFAWARVMVITTGAIALLAFAFGDYMSRVVSLGQSSSAIYAGLTVIVLTALNIAGLRDSARTQNVLTSFLIVGMLGVVIASLIAPAPAASAAAAATGSGIPAAALGSAMLFVLFAFSGWNEAAYVSAEVKGGSRALVRALAIAIGLITVLYLAFVWGLLNGLGFEGLKGTKTAAADVAQRAFGTTGERIVGAVVALAALTSINATMIVGARTNYAVANDWPIVAFMNRWDGTRNVPVAAFLVQGGIALALVIFAAFEQGGVRTMVDFTSPVFYTFFLLTGVALIVLRFKYPHVQRPFKVPMYPILPVIFIGMCAYLLYSSITYAQSQNAVQVALYVMASGLVAWILARLKRGS
ncbi:MAG TPA: amino acid permease [Burkholderiaceae bacterium]|nr:amino acid permease [Burkholderiaceae bacterium]